MENSPFTRLSAELRNAIYELTFRAASPLDLSACLRGKGSFQHPLTQTCSQMRHECLLLFYSNTDFELDDKHDIGTSELGYFEEIPESIEAALWLFSVKPAHVDAMRSVGFRNRDKIMSVTRYQEYVADEAKKGQTVALGERMVGNYHIVCSNGTGTLLKAYRKVLFHEIYLVARLVDVTAEDARPNSTFFSEREPSERAGMQWRSCGLVVLKGNDDVATLGGVVARNEKSDECLMCRTCMQHSRMDCPAEFDEESPFLELSPTNETYQPFSWDENDKDARSLDSVFAPIFESMMEGMLREGLLHPSEIGMGSDESLEEDRDSEDDWEEASDVDNDDDMCSEDELKEGDLGAGSEE